MDPFKTLKLGNKYSKKDLSDLLEQRTLSLVREGLYHCKNSDSTLFFVDLEKKGKEDRFHFDDFFERKMILKLLLMELFGMIGWKILINTIIK